MNWQHFKAFVWLRWRLLYNQARRAGALNAILTMIVVVAAILTVIPLFIGSLMLGLFAIPKAQPVHLMYAWDAVLVAFLFFWLIGLITELQRTDPLSLSKFLHLPVSANGAFLINYLSSLDKAEPDHLRSGDARFQPGARRRQGNRDAAGAAARRGVLADGHRADLSISRLAGGTHEQPPPPANGDHACHRHVRPDRAVAQAIQLRGAVGRHGSKPTRDSAVMQKEIAELSPRPPNRGRSTQTSSLDAERDSPERQKLGLDRVLAAASSTRPAS